MPRRLLLSFSFAFDGVLDSLRTQRNLRIHVLSATIAMVLGGILHLDVLRLAMVAGAAALVLVSELLNTALERFVDLITREFSPPARAAKNIAAGAVLVSSAGALCVGSLVFVPELLRLGLSGLGSMALGPAQVSPGGLIGRAAVSGAFLGGLGALQVERGWRVWELALSGHSLAALSVAAAVLILTGSVLTVILALAVTGLVAEIGFSPDLRYWVRAVFGAALGVFVTSLSMAAF